MDNAFLIKFMRTAVGHEDDLARSLNEEARSALYFKVFGRYDLLEISKLDEINDAIRADSDSRIRSINTFPCFCWEKLEESLWAKLQVSATPIIILLKLQEPVFKKKGLEGLQKTAEFLVALDSDEGVENGFTLIGMGYYEIILWLPQINFNNVYSYANRIRNLKIAEIFPDFTEEDKDQGIFADTTTVPLVSYKEAIWEQNWDKLDGEVCPIVKIKVIPGQEDLVVNQWPNEWRQLLGAEDLACIWNTPISLSDFAKQLITFRNQWKDKLAVIDTTTRLLGHSTYKPDGQGIDLSIPIGPLPFLFERLRDITKNKNINQFAICEIINIISIINTAIGNMALQSTYSDILCSVNYLNSLLIEYEKLADLDDLSKVAQIEDYLLNYANCVHAAIMQHFPSNDYSDISDNSYRLPYSGSLSRIVTAISVIPEQLFDLISKCPPPAKLELRASEGEDPDLVNSFEEFRSQWQGFLFLNLSDGYKVIDQSEILYTPYKDIFQCLNWTTLSHEISHAYYCRLNFELLEKEWLDDLTRSSNVGDAYRDYTYNLKELCFELFAHWFDYTHFFKRDLEFYLWSIWRTWVKLPRIHMFKKHYIIRSVFVKICNSWISIKQEIREILTTKIYEDAIIDIFTIIEREYDYISNFLAKYFPDEYHLVALDDEDKTEVITLVLFYHDLIRKFEDDYVNEELAQRVNLPYVSLDSDIENIFAGRHITDSIPNPFLLLREILRSKYNGNDKSSLSSDATIALIFSLWECSRKYKREVPSIS